MRLFLFIVGLLFRRFERVHGEMDFLGFEAYTRPNETNGSSSPSTPPADKEYLKAA